MKFTNVLGIETSCDETSAAVVQNGRTVLSNVVVSSLNEHEKFGGIIPEIASRRQLEYLNSVVTQALNDARLTLKDIDSIAYTQEPGLIGSLLVGISFAKALGFALDKPFYPVNHIRAHLYANFLDSSMALKTYPERRVQRAPLRVNPEPIIPINSGDGRRVDPAINEKQKKYPMLPAIGLVVSGGHTSLYLVKSFRRFQLVGETLDDAVGEAFDKAARILGLGYPGGPAIDLLAQTIHHSRLKFTCADLPDTLNFSFSGIKTAILYYTRDHKNDPDFSAAHVAFAFQKSVVDVLVQKCLVACRKYKVKTLLIGGGVAANSLLRKKIMEVAAGQSLNIYFPPMPLCLDNAAMIAGLGYHLTKKNPN